MSVSLFAFDNSFARALPACGVSWPVRPAPAPYWVQVNTALAADLGLDVAGIARLCGPEGLAAFSGQSVLVGSAPLAQAYAGHQFGRFSPSLGDGRALLLGEVLDVHAKRQDIALKGSGVTPFSRGGDGLAALGPMLREYLMGEAMHALGVPTTRALGVLGTGEAVQRTTLLPGAVLVRVASSHIRVGSFEYFAARGDIETLRRLLRYTVARHVPAHHLPADALASIGLSSEATQAASTAADALLVQVLLHHVARTQARLLAQWMGLGFVHGVMNTDNMAISGQTIDYGPCAFMEAHDPATVFSSIDRHGRYAYGRQAAVAQWNLARLAESLLPLLLTECAENQALQIANDAVQAFATEYEWQWLRVMRRKLGWATRADLADEGDQGKPEYPECGPSLISAVSGGFAAKVLSPVPLSPHLSPQDQADKALAEDFLKLLQGHSFDHTGAFRRLYRWAEAWTCDPSQSVPAFFSVFDADLALPPVGSPTQAEPQTLAQSSDPAPLTQSKDSETQAWWSSWQQRFLAADTGAGHSAPGRAERLQAMKSANPVYIPRNHLVEAALQAASAENDLAPFTRLLAVLAKPFDERAEDAAYAQPADPEQSRHYQTFCGT